MMPRHLISQPSRYSWLKPCLFMWVHLRFNLIPACSRATKRMPLVSSGIAFCDATQVDSIPTNVPCSRSSSQLEKAKNRGLCAELVDRNGTPHAHVLVDGLQQLFTHICVATQPALYTRVLTSLFSKAFLAIQSLTSMQDLIWRRERTCKAISQLCRVM